MRYFHLAQSPHVIKPIVQEMNTKELRLAYLHIFDLLTLIKKGPEQIEIRQSELIHASRPIESQLLKLMQRAEGIY